MKRIVNALAIVLMIGLAMQGAGFAAAAALKCAGANGKSACTAQQVADLNAGITSGKRMHKPFLMDVKGVTQGKGGTLVCVQDNGSACTDQQLSAVISLAATTKSSDGAIQITKTQDMSSPK